MIVATYARVSTQNQENEETIENQVMAIKEFVQKNGHTVVKEYRDDGWSGRILARPSLDELRLDAKKKVWEAVVIYDPDRLARKYSYQELVTDELNDLGIEVLYVTTPPVRDEGDRLLHGVKGLFAEYERAKIAERFRLGKLRKARNGNVVTSEAPYGYTYILKQGERQGYYEINAREAEVVKMIFSWIADECLTIRQVIRRLKKMKIKPRKSKRGVWNTSTLSTLVRRKAYIGETFYNKTYATLPENPQKDVKYKRVKKSSRRKKPKEDWIGIPIPPIISEDLYFRTQKQLKENTEAISRNVKNEYLLAGKLFCVCGCRRTGESVQKGKHLYYRCTDRVNRHPLPKQCFEKALNARIADKLVWDQLSEFMTSKDVLEKQVKRFMDKNKKDVSIADKSVDRLKEELNKIKKEEDRYIKAYGAEMIDQTQLKEMTEELKKKRKSLEQQIDSMKIDRVIPMHTLPEKDEIEEFCNLTRKVIKDLDFEAKQKITRRLVDTIVGTQHELKVYGHLPLNSSIIANIWKGEHPNVEYETSSRDSWLA